MIATNVRRSVVQLLCDWTADDSTPRSRRLPTLLLDESDRLWRISSSSIAGSRMTVRAYRTDCHDRWRTFSLELSGTEET